MASAHLCSYKNLKVWQYAMDLVSDIYELTDNFPKHELYCLTSQIRKSAISIPSNIAEGKVRKSKNEFRRFLSIAFASGAELETQLAIAEKLNYCNFKVYNKIQINLNNLMKMLNSFIAYLAK